MNASKINLLAELTTMRRYRRQEDRRADLHLRRLADDGLKSGPTAFPVPIDEEPSLLIDRHYGEIPAPGVGRVNADQPDSSDVFETTPAKLRVAPRRKRDHLKRREAGPVAVVSMISPHGEN